MSKSYQSRERPGEPARARQAVPQAGDPLANLGNAATAEDSLAEAAPETELPYLSELEAAFGTPLDHVGAHLGAADTLDPLGANAAAAGDTVAFGEESPDLETVAHEVAHVVQDDGAPGSGDPTRPGHATEREAEDAASAVAGGEEAGPIEAGGGGVHAETLGDVKPAARKAIEVSTGAVVLEQETVDSYFEKMSSGGWGSSVAAPGGAKVLLGGIDAGFLVPMTSLAGELASRSATQPDGSTQPVFVPNMTVTVGLKLKKHGLPDGSYRFTWSGAKADGTGGTIVVESLTSGAPVQNTVAADTAAGSVSAGGVTFSLLGSWAGTALDALNEALSLVPATALAGIKGVKFRRGGSSPGGGEAGHFDPDKNEIVMFDNAFDPTSLRSGTASEAARMIAHEIGHALDLMPLYAPLGGKAENPDSDYEKGAGLSGSKWSRPKGGDTWEVDQRATFKANDFRKAAIADGLAVSGKGALEHGVTEYGETDWQELFAESFSLYTTDPSGLALLRPKISAWFARKYPRK